MVDRGEKMAVQSQPEKAMGNLDRLTGIWNKKEAEAQITSVMHGGGSFFICDIDRLRRINDQYGHLAGDECLKQVAQTLGYMVRRDDVLGRIGGDEFVIFMPDCTDQRQAEEIRRRIENRFNANRGKENRENKGVAIQVRTVCTLWHEGDTYQTMFERASAELAKRKTDHYLTGERRCAGKDNYKKDARRIRDDLIEQIKKPGAYCRDYETFKSIYRFLERGIIRSGQKACVILITVVDEKGRSLSPHEKDAMMERLGEDIRQTLRIGDVYTRYTSSQYLILVIDTTEGQADMIAERVRNKFLADREESDILVHYCYELQAARIKEIEKESYLEI